MQLYIAKEYVSVLSEYVNIWPFFLSFNKTRVFMNMKVQRSGFYLFTKSSIEPHCEILDKEITRQEYNEGYFCQSPGYYPNSITKKRSFRQHFYQDKLFGTLIYF